MQWKPGVLALGLPGKSHQCARLTELISFLSVLGEVSGKEAELRFLSYTGSRCLIKMVKYIPCWVLEALSSFSQEGTSTLGQVFSVLRRLTVKRLQWGLRMYLEHSL